MEPGSARPREAGACRVPGGAPAGLQRQPSPSLPGAHGAAVSTQAGFRGFPPEGEKASCRAASFSQLKGQADSPVCHRLPFPSPTPPAPFHRINPPSPRREEGPIRRLGITVSPQPPFPPSLVRRQTEHTQDLGSVRIPSACRPPSVSAETHRPLSGDGYPQFPPGDLSLGDQSQSGLETVKAQRNLWPHGSSGVPWPGQPASLGDSHAAQRPWEGWQPRPQTSAFPLSSGPSLSLPDPPTPPR